MSEAEFSPTDEQAHCANLFHSGESLAIEAGAGTGKTSTVRLLAIQAGRDRRRGQYIAFNRAIVAEAKAKFPRNVSARTAHSLAYRDVGHNYRRRLDSPRMRSDLIARKLGVNPIVIPGIDGQPKRLAPGWLAGHVVRMVNRFCQVADHDLLERHLPYIDTIDVRGSFVNNNAVAGYLLPYARTMWADLCSSDGVLPFNAGHYLKMWQLSDAPRIVADFILFDEAQDASPVMIDVIHRQESHAQVVWVGDSQQCQPLGAMVELVGGERRAIEQVREGDRVVSFDVGRSFLRKSGDPVTRVARRWYDGWLVGVKTESGEQSRYTPNHRCVVRVGDALQGRWVTYLMRRGTSYRVGIVKGVYESQKGSIGLPMRLQAERADAAWILETHDTESAARLAEAVTSWSFGIPMLRFRQGTTYGMTQADLDQFWTELGDLTVGAERLLAHFGRDPSYPITTRGQRLYRRRSQLMQACNLLDGMLVLPLDGALDADGKQVPIKRWSPIAVERTGYFGPVYSLEVADRHTYVADQIVTGNSIYGFTGARNALKMIDVVNTAYLTQSFRFGPAIASVANYVLSLLGAELRLTGTPSIASRVEAIPSPDCVLTRTNATALAVLLAFQLEGHKVALMGGADELISFARAAADLQAGRSTWHRDLGCFATWNEVLDYVATDPLGDELHLLVSLVSEYGPDGMIEALNRSVDDRSCDVVVSTAHKAKGCEWPAVTLADDFRMLDPERPFPDEELRLLYVAATRPQITLDIRFVPMLGGAGPMPYTQRPALPA